VARESGVVAKRLARYANSEMSMQYSAGPARRLNFYEQCLAIARELGDKRGDGLALASLSFTLKSSDGATPRVHL
jgi:hypothetical protein